MSDMDPAWKVTGQQQGVGPDATGTNVKGRNITYQLADGTIGSVFIPNNAYTVENVKAAIAADAEKLAAVQKLTSGS